MEPGFNGEFYMRRVIKTTVASLLIFCFFLSTDVASALIRGPVRNVPTPDIEIVLLKRETITIWQHHFMCVYVWNGKEWVVGTAGLKKDEDAELALCKSKLEDNTANPDFVLTREEYLDWELQYSQALANRGVGAILGTLGAMTTTPFTLGHTKPCYLEVVFLSDLAQSLAGHEDISPHP